jgi:predicted 3-demethylubiquinone-9 3-methyltransferase (glyoxalase superfamily)
MQHIIPYLWFDTQAKEATAFYTTVFKDSSVDYVQTLSNTPSGDAHIVGFTLLGKKFMAISAGPYFTLNPSISLFVTFDTQAEIDSAWNALAEGGKVLMPYQTYPWAPKYGWVQDKYGLSWQLSLAEQHQTGQKITPLMMFTQTGAGKAKEAIDFYTTVFPHSSTDMIARYEAGEGDTVGFVKHARFTLNGEQFMAMDSSGPHAFVFNEAISFIVKCESQEEIDRYWTTLSAHPESEQCGWLKDKFGVSWQITPTVMDRMMTEGTPEQVQRVTQAFLKMKKFDIATLEEVYNQ